ncbi:MAG: AbrB/MazE/SpoVT family DNA-binding domain-containing protein [Pseudomonadota bacterium]|nr:AbrB/MazE/SpoVT family DNA-binding domain-containing protein [Pseudomonadota bacterium]
MQTKVQRWGNSLAIRLPKAYTQELALENNTEINLSLSKTGIIITPIKKPQLTLEQLLAGITEHNVHAEVSTGDAVGNEVW